MKNNVTKGLLILFVVTCLVWGIVYANLKMRSDKATILETEMPTSLIPIDWTGYKTTNFTLEGKTISLLVADTGEKQEKGLMFVMDSSQLNVAQGMLFQFSDSRPLTFWNKNTFIDLKLYWLKDDQVIGTSDLPSITKSKDIVTVTSPGPANGVIELPAN